MTVRVPVLALDSTATVAVISVEDLTLTELAFTPLPEKLTDAPLTNPVPLIVTPCVPPLSPALGVTDSTLGRALTVKPAASEPTPSSGFLTVTVRASAGALGETVMPTVNSVEFFTVFELTVMPVPENVAVAPLTNPVPLTVMLVEAP